MSLEAQGADELEAIFCEPPTFPCSSLSTPPESEHTSPRQQETRQVTVPTGRRARRPPSPMQVPPFLQESSALWLLGGASTLGLLWGPRTAGTWGRGWAHNWNRRAIHPRAEKQPSKFWLPESGYWLLPNPQGASRLNPPTFPAPTAVDTALSLASTQTGGISDLEHLWKIMQTAVAWATP